MKVFVIDSEEKEVVQEQLQNAKDEIDRINELVERGEHPQNNDSMSEPHGPPFGIVMTGLSLVSKPHLLINHTYNILLISSYMLLRMT